MEPISIRLSIFEMKALLDIANYAFKKCNEATESQKPYLRSGLIILAEFYPAWKKKCAAVDPYAKRVKGVPKYKIPVSVAQIVHNRLQHYPRTEGNQLLLNNLDRALVNRSLRPVFDYQIAK
jgi:hypothetical protein